MRTIYMHFPTKAAIMLAYFDRWVDAFSEEIRRRPVDEPVVDTVQRALTAMSEAGWGDKVESLAAHMHPITEHLEAGSPDIAGHILQRWMREIEVLTLDARARGDYPEQSFEPQARATAIFTSWIAAVFAARRDGRAEGGAQPERVDGVGIAVLSLIADGRV